MNVFVAVKDHVLRVDPYCNQPYLDIIACQWVVPPEYEELATLAIQDPEWFEQMHRIVRLVEQHPLTKEEQPT